MNLITSSSALEQAAQLANQYAAANVFTDYRIRKAAQTRRRHAADLALFAQFLSHAAPVDPQALAADPAAWHSITWGLVEGFKLWMLQQGYAMGSVNSRLSTVKKYAQLAFKAGAISDAEHALIRTVEGYRHKDSKHVDDQRDTTRMGAKKSTSVALTKDQANTLKQQPDTPQGRRDAVLMCLLLDHGLRAGEVAGLLVENINLKSGEIVFYRSKVDKVQTHRLSPDALRAIKAWFKHGDVPAIGPLLRGSQKGGALTTTGMTTRAITQRVQVLGEALGIAGLSAHDCRHHWATRAARGGTDPFALQEAGGWNSLAMPRRYVEDAKIANEGVRFDE
jgi:integrase